MLWCQNMRRSWTEGLIRHRVQDLCGEGVLEAPANGIGIHFFKRCANAEGFLSFLAQRIHLWIKHIVFPVIHDVVGIEGIAIRPPGTLDEFHRQLLAVFGPFPASGNVWQRLQFLGFNLEERSRAGQALLEANVDTTPALALSGPIVPTLGTAANHMAHHVSVNTDAIFHVAGLVNHRLFGQAVLDGRQAALIDEIRRHPIGFAVFVESLVFKNISNTYKIDLALGIKFCRIRQWRWFGHLSLHRSSRNAECQHRGGNNRKLCHHKSSQFITFAGFVPTFLVPQFGSGTSRHDSRPNE